MFIAESNHRSKEKSNKTALLASKGVVMDRITNVAKVWESQSLKMNVVTVMRGVIGSASAPNGKRQRRIKVAEALPTLPSVI